MTYPAGGGICSLDRRVEHKGGNNLPFENKKPQAQQWVFELGGGLVGRRDLRRREVHALGGRERELRGGAGIDALVAVGVQHVILCVSYKAEMLEANLNEYAEQLGNNNIALEISRRISGLKTHE